MIVVEEDLRYSDAARALSISERTLRRLVKARKIGFNKPCRIVTFSPHHIDAFRRASEQKPKGRAA